MYSKILFFISFPFKAIVNFSVCLFPFQAAHSTMYETEARRRLQIGKKPCTQLHGTISTYNHLAHTTIGKKTCTHGTISTYVQPFAQKQYEQLNH
jgi:hypothetical protein